MFWFNSEPTRKIAAALNHVYKKTPLQFQWTTETEFSAVPLCVAVILHTAPLYCQLTVAPITWSGRRRLLDSAWSSWVMLGRNICRLAPSDGSLWDVLPAPAYPIRCFWSRDSFVTSSFITWKKKNQAKKWLYFTKNAKIFYAVCIITVYINKHKSATTYCKALLIKTVLAFSPISWHDREKVAHVAL